MSTRSPQLFSLRRTYQSLRRRSSLSYLLVCILLIFVLHRLSSAPQVPSAAHIDLVYASKGGGLRFPASRLGAAPGKGESLERCEWMKRLLAEDHAVGAPLPKPGSPRKAGTFWLKEPLLHTQIVDPETKLLEDIMILRYKIYNRKWSQHTDKFSNTVKVLSSTDHREKPIFPKLHGYCTDIDGFHVIAVEFIDNLTEELPKPRNLGTCVDRALKALNLFNVLHKDFGMALVDFKKGQWMVRNDGSFVLQDIDDILPEGSDNPYENQVQMYQRQVSATHKLPIEVVKDIWENKMFPNKSYTIRYSMLGFNTLIHDLGFSWSRDCDGFNSKHRNCLLRLEKWANSILDNWPRPEQLMTAITQCFETEVIRMKELEDYEKELEIRLRQLDSVE